MKMNEIMKEVNILKDILKKNAPMILTSLGIGAEVGAIAFTVKGTKEAVKIIEEKKPKGKWDAFKAVWKSYVPAAILGLGSIGCFIASNSINSHRYLAILGAFKMSEGQLKDYKDKVSEIIGKDKEKDINKDAQNNKETVIVTNGEEEILFKDKVSGREFKSTINKINYAVAVANKIYAANGCVYLNDIYETLGLDSIDAGDMLGWGISYSGNGIGIRDVIEVEFSGSMTNNMKPCLLIDFTPKPKLIS